MIGAGYLPGYDLRQCGMPTKDCILLRRWVLAKYKLKNVIIADNSCDRSS